MLAIFILLPFVPQHLPQNVEKIKACAEPAKTPNITIGNRIYKLTKDFKTAIVNSSARAFPNNQKLNDNSFAKSSKTLISRRSRSG